MANWFTTVVGFKTKKVIAVLNWWAITDYFSRDCFLRKICHLMPCDPQIIRSLRESSNEKRPCLEVELLKFNSETRILPNKPFTSRPLPTLPQIKTLFGKVTVTVKDLSLLPPKNLRSELDGSERSLASRPTRCHQGGWGAPARQTHVSSCTKFPPKHTQYTNTRNTNTHM